MIYRDTKRDVKSSLATVVLFVALAAAACMLAFGCEGFDYFVREDLPATAPVVVDEFVRNAPDNPLSLTGWIYAAIAALTAGGGYLIKRRLTLRKKV